ncbi:hypothetical protein [Streptomyces hundungensis]|uniref:hypothetical protein n=1 Tax=Streptomyces hundungensis TaxID=1077946 RepID=UPI0033DEEF57
MHSDIHLQMHHQRATELAAEARATLPRERHLRAQLGRLLVELGLRLTQQAPRHRTRLA